MRARAPAVVVHLLPAGWIQSHSFHTLPTTPPRPALQGGRTKQRISEPSIGAKLYTWANSAAADLEVLIPEISHRHTNADP
jgi:hypothetical protein